MEIPKFYKEKPKEPSIKPEQGVIKKTVEREGLFDSAAAIAEETTILEKLRGKSRGIAKVLILASVLIAGEGKITEVRALEQTTQSTIQIKKEKKSVSEIKKFINFNQKQQEKYLRKLAELPEENVSAEFRFKPVMELKEKLDELYENETDLKHKEKINEAFLTVHGFILEYCIDVYGRQVASIFNLNTEEASVMNITRFINRTREGIPIYDPHETDKFLNDGKRGPLLEAFIEKSKNISGNELSKIKQIYDLVAYQIPRFKFYHSETKDYQSFEELLKNRAGICMEKNALLVYTLRQAGFEAFLWPMDQHIYTRVFTPEGVLEIDVTDSSSFHLYKPTTQGAYSFITDKNSIKYIPKSLQKYIRKGSGENYEVYIHLDSEEAINFAATENNISVDMLKEILFKIADIKPHPLYEMGRQGKGELTPAISGQYSQDLFKKYE